MSNQTPNPNFYLIADYVDGPWGGVVATWCDHACQPALCLTNDPERATAYLITARRVDYVVDTLRDGDDLNSDTPAVWINDYTGKVHCAASIQELLCAVMSPVAARSGRSCHCGRRSLNGASLDPLAWCDLCEADYQDWLDVVALSEAPNGEPS